MDTIRLDVRRGQGHDADKWIWWLDRGGGQLAQGVEESHVECFAAAAAVLAQIEEGVAEAWRMKQPGRRREAHRA